MEYPTRHLYFLGIHTSLEEINYKVMAISQRRVKLAKVPMKLNFCPPFYP